MTRRVRVWVLLALACGCAHTPPMADAGRDALFQVSTISALMLGLYDGTFTCGELRQRGDLGLGTFNQLDGEMVVLDGKVYQVRGDGHVYAASDTEATPFATVTHFEADAQGVLRGAPDFASLEKELARLAANENLFHAIRIEGTFSYVKTRAVPKQSKPYPPLVEVSKVQPEFEFHDVSGVIVGFWTPPYAQGLNVAGYHLHFLTDDRSRGGHLLECAVDDAVLQIDICREFRVLLPDDDAFKAANLGQDLSEQIEQVER